MNNDDDGTPLNNRQPEEADLGPEPDWLVEDGDQPAMEPAPVDGHPIAEPAGPDQELPSPISPPGEDSQSHPEAPIDKPLRKSALRRKELVSSPAAPGEDQTSELVTIEEPGRDSEKTEATSSVEQIKSHRWLWGGVPVLLLLATGIIAWFGTTQTLNDLTTWNAIRANNPPLLPARWAMTVWWLVLPLMAVFLIYGSLPVGRAITRIRITGPLISIALVATCMWIFAQHWDWEVIGIASMAIAAIALLASYLLVVLGPHITKIRQRIIAVIPLSAALGYSVVLTVLAWQSYSSQPFGDRGSSLVFVLILVMATAVFAFFLRDGLFGLVLAIWFAGVVHQQWGEDAVISLVAVVALLFTAALAGLGTILATESHRPSMTTSADTRRSRISFFRKSVKPPVEELP